MAGTNMTNLLCLIEEQLQPQNVADLQYVLKNCLTSKFHYWNFSLVPCIIFYIASVVPYYTSPMDHSCILAGNGPFWCGKTSHYTR